MGPLAFQLPCGSSSDRGQFVFYFSGYSSQELCESYHVYLSILSIHGSIYPSIHRSIYPIVHPSINLSVRLSESSSTIYLITLPLSYLPIFITKKEEILYPACIQMFMYVNLCTILKLKFRLPCISLPRFVHNLRYQLFGTQWIRGTTPGFFKKKRRPFQNRGWIWTRSLEGAPPTVGECWIIWAEPLEVRPNIQMTHGFWKPTCQAVQVSPVTEHVLGYQWWAPCCSNDDWSTNPPPGPRTLARNTPWKINGWFTYKSPTRKGK